jgi:hypothetical protein
MLAAIRAGAMPWVAAEVAGVPADLFQVWMRSLEIELCEFREEIRKAAAVARFKAEQRVLNENPLAWLTKGPGKSEPGKPGWGERSEITGADGGAVQLETTAAINYDLLTIEEAEELDALEKRRAELVGKASVKSSPS